MRRVAYGVVLIVLVLCGSMAVAKLPRGDEAFQKMMDGNKRFVASSSVSCDLSEARKKQLVAGQNPSAIVVTCSDSRVAPEHIFNQGLGDIFVIRTAGNVLDPVALGSIEYAAEHLHTPLLVIMGHEKCGAVSAAMDSKEKPEGNIGAIIAKILPAIEKAKASGGSKDDMLNRAIRENVALSHDAVLKQSRVLKHLAEEGELRVVEAMYHLGDGGVEVIAGGSEPVVHEHHAK